MKALSTRTVPLVALVSVFLIATGCSANRCQPGYLELFAQMQELRVDDWQIGFNALAVGCGRDLKLVEDDIELVRGLTRDHVAKEGFLLMHTASDPEARASLVKELQLGLDTTDRIDIFFYDLSFTELR